MWCIRPSIFQMCIRDRFKGEDGSVIDTVDYDPQITGKTASGQKWDISSWGDTFGNQMCIRDSHYKKSGSFSATFFIIYLLIRIKLYQFSRLNYNSIKIY